MGTRSQYQLADIIREARERKYKNAKDFWTQNESALGVSYQHYSYVEAGTRLPDIELAITISKILNLDMRLVCHAWAKDQMPTAEAKSFFEPTPGLEVQGIPTTFRQLIDEFFVMTEKHIPMLLKYPFAWSVLNFILAFGDTTPPTEADIQKMFSLPAQDVQQIVEWARNEGIVISENGKLKTKYRFIHLPNKPEFKQVRDNNFTLLSSELLQKIKPEELMQKEANRITYLRRITRVQAQELSRKIEELVGQFGNMEDSGSEFYGLGVILGSRFRFHKEG